ncbi:hypothetical protein ACFFMM_06525 [Micromonospora chaiyaphumensis]|uniref:Uncharacterized protein n=1 Tax=Micromonospora chaiyaphumensis TaxID=307119 RepID=A0A1C4VJR8_9ACTN|nr:hypothetical protein [Micromonospora chaiyaphumensis]SCE84254.1 hypothetical protein GA0070214_102455 [Micromonospora chaiyaphumensis]
MTAAQWHLGSRTTRLMIASFLFALVATISSMVYANAVARESVQNLCALVVTLDDTYRATPPQTPTGRQIADQVSKLRTSLDCPAPA